MSTTQETPGPGGVERGGPGTSRVAILGSRLRGLTRVRPLSRRVALEAGLVLLASFALVVVLTWPLLPNIATDVPGGGSGGDRSGYTWDVWFNAEHGLRLWGSTYQEAVSAPFGRLMPASANVLQITFLGPAWLFGQFVGPVAALNLSLLIGMTLTPAAMYLLIRWLGLGIVAAIWAGAAFALFPNFLIRASGHYPMAFLACFPILLLALWRWMEAPGWRRAWWLAAATAFCWMSNPYYGAMGSVMLAIGVGVAAIGMARESGPRTALRRVGEIVATTTGLVLIPLGLLFWSSSDAVESAFERSRQELDTYGARVTDYLLPDSQQWFFGHLFGAADWASKGGPGGERSNFLGYATMLLAIVGVVLAVRGWASLSRRLRLVVLSAGPLIVVLAWFSLATPTYWGGQRIPTPSGVVFDLAPFLRVYARFAIAVTAVVIVLGAIGLAALVQRRHAIVAGAVLVVAVGVATVELPPGGGLPLQTDPPLTVNGRAPEDVPTWAWLRDNAPRDAILYEFPGGANEFLERYHMHGQLVHGLTIVNGDPVGRGIGSDVTSAFPNPGVPHAAERLAGLGVDLVAVDPWLWSVVGTAPPADLASVPPGFRALKTFPDGSAVWAVTARPDPAVPIFQRLTWWAPERVGEREWRYMKDEAAMWVYAPRAGTYRVSFGARSRPPSRVRHLVIDGPGGQVEQFDVGRAAELSFTVRLKAGRNDFALTNEGAPARQISASDLRIVSIQMSEWTVARAPGDGPSA
jgi:hypothetical protein